AVAEAGGGAERVGVVHHALEDHGDGLESAVRVLGEPGDRRPVVHGPAVSAGEVLADLPAFQRGGGPHGGAVGGGEPVPVVGGEQERVDPRPLGPERDDLANYGHGL